MGVLRDQLLHRSAPNRAISRSTRCAISRDGSPTPYPVCTGSKRSTESAEQPDHIEAEAGSASSPITASRSRNSRLTRAGSCSGSEVRISTRTTLPSVRTNAVCNRRARSPCRSSRAQLLRQMEDGAEHILLTSIGSAKRCSARKEARQARYDRLVLVAKRLIDAAHERLPEAGGERRARLSMTSPMTFNPACASGPAIFGSMRKAARGRGANAETIRCAFLLRRSAKAGSHPLPLAGGGRAKRAGWGLNWIPRFRGNQRSVGLSVDRRRTTISRHRPTHSPAYPQWRRACESPAPRAPDEIAAQIFFAAEQMRAAADIEQQAVRRIEPDQRRVAIAPVGDMSSAAASAASSASIAASCGYIARASASAMPARRPNRAASSFTAAICRAAGWSRPRPAAARPAQAIAASAGRSASGATTATGSAATNASSS